MEFGGFMFGIGGVLTYRKSVLPSVLPLIPMDRVVLETDCPYLSPVPFRGKRNEPSYIVNTAVALAQVYGVSTDEVARVTRENACRMFRL
jgi:TatD DNase family protein